MNLSLTLADVLLVAGAAALAVAALLDLASRTPRRAGRPLTVDQLLNVHRGVRIRITDQAGLPVVDMDSDLLHLVARWSPGGHYVTHLVRTDLGLMSSEPEPSEYALRIDVEPVELPDRHDDDQDQGEHRRRWPRIVQDTPVNDNDDENGTDR